MARTHTMPSPASNNAVLAGNAGENVSWTLQGSKLTLEVDISKNLGPSGSGKTTIIGSTKGNARIGDVTVGLNVFRKIEGK